MNARPAGIKSVATSGTGADPAGAARNPDGAGPGPVPGISPHGGKMIDRRVAGEARNELMSRVRELPRIGLGSREVSDTEMISVGAFSPLEGFMNSADYVSVVREKRLAAGLPWTIPVTLAVPHEQVDGVAEGEDLLLEAPDLSPLAVLHLEEKYAYDKEREAQLVYGTTDTAHPGVAFLIARGDVLLGGKISLLERPKQTEFLGCRLDPMDTRLVFEERGWRRIVGFQTRNPIHRAHEYILKCALEVTDGLLLHPIVGDTKSDDVPAAVRMQCYRVLMEKYYPAERVLLSALPAAMRYAGPREAIFHAIVRKNYGCTHFIVGRDHAGVGNYYGSFDAHYIFDEFGPEELGITPLFFDYTFHCKKCGGMASHKTCPHDDTEHLSLSGTKVRELLRSGGLPPLEFTRPEVAEVLARWVRGEPDYSI